MSVGCETLIPEFPHLTFSLAEKSEKSEKFKCGVTEECGSGKYAYRIKSGEGRDSSPIICFDGH